MFLKSASFVSFTDKNFKCLTEIKILSVRMSDTKIQDIIHRTRTCLTENYSVWHDVSFCQTECLTSLKSFQEVCMTSLPRHVTDKQEKTICVCSICIFNDLIIQIIYSVLIIYFIISLHAFHNVCKEKFNFVMVLKTETHPTPFWQRGITACINKCFHSQTHQASLALRS